MHFYRGNKTGYWGIENINNCSCEKYFISRNILNCHKKIIEKFPNSKIKSNFKEMEDKYEFTKQKRSPQAGSLVFEYLKINKIFNQDSNIYLVGFTSQYKNGLWNGHSKVLEDNYFKEQILEFSNLQYINDHLN
jgi:hypothetical protein